VVRIGSEAEDLELSGAESTGPLVSRVPRACSRVEEILAVMCTYFDANWV
jgi:hypothetical protein